MPLISRRADSRLPAFLGETNTLAKRIGNRSMFGTDWCRTNRSGPDATWSTCSLGPIQRGVRLPKKPSKLGCARCFRPYANAYRELPGGVLLNKCTRFADLAKTLRDRHGVLDSMPSESGHVDDVGGLRDNVGPAHSSSDEHSAPDPSSVRENGTAPQRSSSPRGGRSWRRSSNCFGRIAARASPN